MSCGCNCRCKNVRRRRRPIASFFYSQDPSLRKELLFTDNDDGVAGTTIYAQTDARGTSAKPGRLVYTTAAVFKEFLGKIEFAETLVYNANDSDKSTLSATAIYSQTSANGLVTNVPAVTFTVTGASGRFRRAKTVVIKYNNEVEPRVRSVRVFA